MKTGKRVCEKEIFGGKLKRAKERSLKIKIRKRTLGREELSLKRKDSLSLDTLRNNEGINVGGKQNKVRLWMYNWFT